MKRKSINIFFIPGLHKQLLQPKFFLDSIFGAVGSLFGGASGVAAGSATAASAAAMAAAAEEIIGYTDEYRDIVRDDTRDTRKNVNKIVNQVKRIPRYWDLAFNRAKGVSSFIDESQNIAQSSYDFQTDQKRSGLAFSLGGADELMRKAQLDFAKLASGDTSSFLQETRAATLGALAQTAGMPMGAFENLSAKNMMSFRQLGTERALGISDFFAKQGTVDPVDPIDSMFKLAGFEREEDVRAGELNMFNRKLDFERMSANLQAMLAKAGMKVDTENNILGILADMEAHALDTYADALKFGAGAAGGEELGQSQALGSMGEAISGVGSALSGSGLFGGIFG